MLLVHCPKNKIQTCFLIFLISMSLWSLLWDLVPRDWSSIAWLMEPFQVCGIIGAALSWISYHSTRASRFKHLVNSVMRLEGLIPKWSIIARKDSLVNKSSSESIPWNIRIFWESLIKWWFSHQFAIDQLLKYIPLNPLKGQTAAWILRLGCSSFSYWLIDRLNIEITLTV